MNSQSRSVFIHFYPWLALGEPVPRGHDDLFGDIADFQAPIAGGQTDDQG